MKPANPCLSFPPAIFCYKRYFFSSVMLVWDFMRQIYYKYKHHHLYYNFNSFVDKVETWFIFQKIEVILNHTILFSSLYKWHYFSSWHFPCPIKSTVTLTIPITYTAAIKIHNGHKITETSLNNWTLHLFIHWACFPLQDDKK